MKVKNKLMPMVVENRATGPAQYLDRASQRMKIKMAAPEKNMDATQALMKYWRVWQPSLVLSLVKFNWEYSIAMEDALHSSMGTYTVLPSFENEVSFNISQACGIVIPATTTKPRQARRVTAETLEAKRFVMITTVGCARIARFVGLSKLCAIVTGHCKIRPTENVPWKGLYNFPKIPPIPHCGQGTKECIHT
jgi:hypothetical protein